MSPRAAWPLFRIKKNEINSGATQIIGRREARLPCTDYHDIVSY